MIQEALPHLPNKKFFDRDELSGNPSDETPKLSDEGQTSSTLLEFPGTTRTVPEWRKQLSQRVREVQERKAREAAEELAAAQEAGLVSCALPSAQLELVPDLEQRVMNPIVSKALERIERARRGGPASSQLAATATAPAFAPEVDERPDAAHLSDAVTKPKLKVVAPPKPVVQELSKSKVEKLQPAVEKQEAKQTRERKQVRVISVNVEDVALSYLETCLSVPVLANERNYAAGFPRRIIAGTLDLLFMAVMVAPVAAAIEFSDGDWSDPRVIGVMTAITVVTMFAYLTISVAMTGRTLAMRMLSLRAIDLHTGLIPTGGQSIRRALGCIISFAFVGLGFAYAFIDPDQRTIPDRLSQTMVVRG